LANSVRPKPKLSRVLLIELAILLIWLNFFTNFDSVLSGI
jgi:hypothetical protein